MLHLAIPCAAVRSCCGQHPNHPSHNGWHGCHKKEATRPTVLPSLSLASAWRALRCETFPLVHRNHLRKSQHPQERT